MAEAYDIIAHIYLKHLIRTSRKKRESWSLDVGQAVSSDTEELKRTISELVGFKTSLHSQSHSSDPSKGLTLTRLWFQAPGLQFRPVMLPSVPDVLKSNDIDSLKIICASSQRNCGKNWYAARSSRTLALYKVCSQTQKFLIDFSSASYLCFPPVCSKDLDLIPDLLRWKGLSKSRVTEVLEALPGGAPTPRSRCFCCYCWCDPKTTELLK